MSLRERLCRAGCSRSLLPVPQNTPPAGGVFCLWEPGILRGDDAGGLLSVGAAIAVGAAIGLALGILVSVTTDVPLAPEDGLVLGALAGWLWSRDSV